MASSSTGTYGTRKASRIVLRAQDKATVAEVEQRIARIRSSAAEEIFAALQQRIDDLDDDSLREMDSQLRQLRFDRREVSKDLSDLASTVAVLDELRDSLDQLKDEERQLRTRRQELSKQYDRLTWLMAAFSAKGIPSMLLDSILAAIEDEQNSLLSQMPSMSGMTVEFRQGRALKGKEGMKDALDIVVKTANGHERFIESFSYGQITRLAFSNIFAMIIVFNNRHGNLVRDVYFDEFMSSLDEKSIPAMIEVLGAIVRARLVEGVKVVTHDSRVMEALPQQMVVELDRTEGSKVHVRL